MGLTFTSPQSFSQALRRFPRASLPTALKSADIQRVISTEVQEKSFFSAQTLLENLLDTYKQRIEAMISPKQVRREDRVTPDNPEGFVSEAPDDATVRQEVKKILTESDYKPEADKEGTIEDLSSEGRINLVIDFNRTEARAYGHHLQSLDPDFADAFPCQELVRFRDSHEPRNWDVIWQDACGAAGDTVALEVYRRTGRMVARKDSGVWLAISDFNRPWPPFKWGSGMGLRDIDRQESMSLGLIGRDDQITLQRQAFNDQPLAA